MRLLTMPTTDEQIAKLRRRRELLDAAIRKLEAVRQLRDNRDTTLVFRFTNFSPSAA